MTKRVAISLPDDLYRRLETARKARRIPRSTLIQEAVGDYVTRNDEDELEAAYFEGYRRVPDGNDPDFAGIEAVGIADLKKARLR